MQKTSGELIPHPGNDALVVGNMPASISAAGAAAAFAWEEFFSGKLRNLHTRAAYLRAVRRFLGWAESHKLELARLTPGMVGRYFDELPLSVPSKKLDLAAIRSFFDVLVQRHVMILNPAASVRTERYSVMEGKTPEITVEQSRKLLASIKLESVVDLRDRAVIATLIYTAARAGAVAKVRVGDLVEDGTQLALRFAEKGGKARSIPVRHDLQVFLQEYIFVGELDNEPNDSALFRTVAGSNGRLSSKQMTGVDICRMVKRRLAAAGLPTLISPHSFRSCAATDLLLQGVGLEDVQYLLGHSDSRITKLYDRRQKQVTRNIVERISV
jgi:site-specific recombinase XerD